jgi:hypothetical protein
VASTAAVNATCMHGTATEASTASTSKAAATATAPGEGVVRNQRRANKHDRCEKYESISKHDTSPCYFGADALDGTQNASRDVKPNEQEHPLQLSHVGKIEIDINQRNRWPSITPRLESLAHPAKTTTMTEPHVVSRMFEIG